MSSIIKGYEYDIFVSYRQNDNRYDSWVTRFVADLNKDLDATIKEKITVYLDENPIDGLLESHNVDKSLSNKLKSLIFIPVLSKTYCDPNSYAWQNEFLLFNKTAYDIDMAAGEKSVECAPESFSVRYYMGYSYHCAGNLEKAIQDYNQAINISGRHCWALTSLLALLSEPSEFQQINKANFIYRELLTKEKTGFVNPFLMATASAALGKNEEAVRYLRLALVRHDPYFAYRNRPDNKALCKIPDYNEIIRAMGFPWLDLSDLKKD